jgi:hypothetical protein
MKITKIKLICILALFIITALSVNFLFAATTKVTVTSSGQSHTTVYANGSSESICDNASTNTCTITIEFEK